MSQLNAPGAYFRVSPFQFRAARAILQLGVREVARETGMSPTTVNKLEKSAENVTVGAVDKVVSFYLRRGISFIQNGVQFVDPQGTFDIFNEDSPEEDLPGHFVDPKETGGSGG